MRTVTTIAVTAVLALTGCTEEVYLSVPHVKAVKPKLDTPVKCGRVHYRKCDSIRYHKDANGIIVIDPRDADCFKRVARTCSNGCTVIDSKDANCLKRQMQACAHDRRVLVVANRANVRTIEQINAHARTPRR